MACQHCKWQMRTQGCNNPPWAVGLRFARTEGRLRSAQETMVPVGLRPPLAAIECPS